VAARVRRDAGAEGAEQSPRGDRDRQPTRVDVDEGLLELRTDVGMGAKRLAQAGVDPLPQPRPRLSAAAYRKIWTERGSPLLVNSEELAKKVARELESEFEVELAMRYGKPSIQSAVDRLRGKGIQELTALPLYPQRAASSTGSSIAELYRVLGSSWDAMPVKIGEVTALSCTSAGVDRGSAAGTRCWLTKAKSGPRAGTVPSSARVWSSAARHST